MNLTAFGNCMKRNREKHNITLDDLAQRTGLCKELLQAFEDGKSVCDWREY
ncbi:MAG: helix-turn-helix domain-containing protein [Lachnospiraceae bacterium]|nr:helix-turn-helix domain-containing protein [Lachnospiraceae bacterium]